MNFKTSEDGNREIDQKEKEGGIFRENRVKSVKSTERTRAWVRRPEERDSSLISPWNCHQLSQGKTKIRLRAEWIQVLCISLLDVYISYVKQSFGGSKSILLLLGLDMDDTVNRENGRHKTDHYKSVHAQWMMPQHQMKDSPTMKLMGIIAERDNAIQELNIAISERRAAITERDMAIVQRDGAIAERNAAIMERDNALAALDYARKNSMNEIGAPGSPPGCPTQHVTDSYPISTASDGAVKGRKTKRSRKETNDEAANPVRKASKAPKKGRRISGTEDLSKQFISAKPLNEWRSNSIGGEEDLNKQISDLKYQEWKVQDLGLNQVPFDESTVRPPGCSCTGKLQHCYKWGSGGWQSACCTKTLSMYPLPVMPNKRHARVAGRKMSGSAFAKLLTRLATDGYDLSAPLDLKDHWAKHGTNRYITIK